MDRVQPLVYQALQPMKADLEQQYKGEFETFELEAIFEGYPSAGYVLEVKAPWTKIYGQPFRDMVRALHQLKQESEYARYVKSIKILND